MILYGYLFSIHLHMMGEGGSEGKQGQEDGQCGQAAQASSVGLVFLCAGHWFYCHHAIYQIVVCSQPWLTGRSGCKMNWMTGQALLHKYACSMCDAWRGETEG